MAIATDAEDAAAMKVSARTIHPAIDCRSIRMVSPVLRFPPGNLLVPHKGDPKVRMSHQLGNAALPALQLLRQRHCSHGRSDSAALAAQLIQLSSSSSLAITAQLHQQQQLSYYSSAAPAAQQCAATSLAALQPCSLAALQPCSRATTQLCSLAAVQQT